MTLGGFNTYKKYQLIDLSGNVIDSFYHENTARQFRDIYKKNFREKLRLVIVDEQGKIIQERKSGNKKDVVTN